MSKLEGRLAEPEVSVCIVTYKAKDVLRDCLRSLCENTALPYEIIVVDNGSGDDLAGMLQSKFPTARLIENTTNMGYTAPMNQALHCARGRYLMQLNPDTYMLPGALDQLVTFMETHPKVGICGPKVLNRDHTLQRSCRRGEPTPVAVFSYFLGLPRLFPKSRLLGQYQLNYLDENETALVAGVSGSCMLIRRSLIDQIGYLDERFFAYQEDADYCRRAREAGWQVCYLPEAQIVHFGGLGGSQVEPYRSILAWHKSYFLYYEKYLAKNYFLPFNWLFYAAMLLKLCLTLVVNLFREEKFVSVQRP
jgi:GT2 family glycosyltransferase